MNATGRCFFESSKSAFSASKNGFVEEPHIEHDFIFQKHFRSETTTLPFSVIL